MPIEVWSTMIRNGMRVVQGPNWRWGNQDGGEGHLGTIVKYDSSEDVVSVKWDSGKSSDKSMGLELGLDSDGDLSKYTLDYS